LIEITNQLFKNKVQDTMIRDTAEALEEEFALHPVNTSTIKKAIDIKSKYKFSFWDSLIVASALENKCGILYTEDLQHGQVIETNLKVVNPFK
jgi:predicted nucleic acid-binding protein